MKWKHFSRYWSFVRGIHRSSVDFLHTGQWRGVLIFSLICSWINDWVNNREADDLRRHRAHYDVIIFDRMYYHNISHIRRTKSESLNLTCLIMQLFCALFWSQVSNREWRYSRSSADRPCFNYIWVINNPIAYWDASYIRGFTVYCFWEAYVINAAMFNTSWILIPFMMVMCVWIVFYRPWQQVVFFAFDHGSIYITVNKMCHFSVNLDSKYND